MVGDGGQLAGVSQHTGDEPTGHGREVVLVGVVVERVAVPIEERHVGVHARSLNSGQRLRHERGHDSVPGGDLLDDHPHGHHRVGHGHGVGVAEIDLVLARGVLVLAVLDGDAHVLQGQHGLAAQLTCQVVGGQVEVGALVEGHRRQPGGAVGRRGEVEVLELRSHEEGETEAPGSFQGSAQYVAGIAFERRAVEVHHVTHNSRNWRPVGQIGQELEGLGVRAWPARRFLEPG